MMEFNAQNYYLVVEEEGKPVIENEKLLLQNINGKLFVYHSILYNLKFFRS